MAPVNGFSFCVWWFAASTFIVSMALQGVEHVLLKFLSVVVYQRFLPIADDFFARFLFLSNLFVSSLIGLVNCYSVEFYEIAMRASGLPTSMNTYDRFQPRYSHHQCECDCKL